MNRFARLLVVVPHPDDEALLTAGLIRRAVLEGKQVSVAIVTNGDYLCGDHSKGEARLRESLRALTELGVPPGQIYLLGYPDTGFEPEVSFLAQLWTAPADKLFPSTAAAQSYALPDHPDWCMQHSGYHAPYTRAAFCRDLQALLAACRPDLVVTTAEADLHGDHSALCRFVRQAVRTLPPPLPTVWVGMVHSPDGDLCWPRLTDALTGFEPPATDWGAALDWERRICVPLPDAMTAARTADSQKYKLIAGYTTALNPDEPEVCDYLLAFAKQEEIFWEIPN